MSDPEKDQGRRTRTENGGKEGTGRGDGDGDGSKETTQHAHGIDGKGFAFGKMAKERKSGEGSSDGIKPNLTNSAPKLSYRDKLLSPGCVGFLVKHSRRMISCRGGKTTFTR